ncbi:hypothetical protein EHS25_005426 [Saitozyma podzolica]|uniref:Uncharacterized protein n=1 Tax=Saitozyma podzolica TaxID=1890683 RepID=A0A427XYB3_9TREE|nr:hypothetical protein EHS25_005426 [Saitozyma podzolica]
MSLKWSRIPAEELPRSSHSVSVIDDKAYIFGGEVQPRKPVDNALHVIDLATGEHTVVQGKGDVPEPRVGHTAVVLGGRIYVFGGRGGTAMTPLEEFSCLHRFHPSDSTWTRLQPSPEAPGPVARSYHCSAASTSHIFVHAGCPSSGRLNDTWAYDISSNAWTQLSDAPGDPRGGASIVWFERKLWRFGGFNGKTEVGGGIDYLDLGLARDNEHSQKSQSHQSQWGTVSFGEVSGLGRDTSKTLKHNEDTLGPGARSVCGIHPDPRGGALLTLFGEGKPSPTGGHDAAGNFWGDVWAFDPATSRWKEVEQGGDDRPVERGWFASAQAAEGVVLWEG